MKKYTLCIVAVIAAVMMSACPSSALSGKDIFNNVLNEVVKSTKQSKPIQSSTKTESKPSQPVQTTQTATNEDTSPVESGGDITWDLWQLAYSIMKNNKHAFEVQLKGKELTYRSWEDEEVEKRMKTGWNRVWAKDKTIVVGTAMNTKKDFVLEYIITADPHYTFGGVHVGMSVQELKRVIKNTQTSYTDLIEKANYTCLSIFDLFGDINTTIMHRAGRVTSLGYFRVELSVSSRTEAFVKSKMKEMGMIEFPSEYSK